ncbi:MAG: histidine kinase [Anaerolineae bacterium]|nr:histidine kinase [Anaerolineae bacterium]
MTSVTESTIVATIGGQAQVVTFALDDLLGRGEVIRRVIVVHLAPDAGRRRTASALAQLADEFAGNEYAGGRCRLELFPIRYSGSRLDDIRDEVAAGACWSEIYRLMGELKAQGARLHVCIAGGRRMLALLAMSAAMLHFDHNDRLWHLYTPAELLERARDGAVMHVGPEEGVRLIQVPLMPWGAYFPALRGLAGSGPADVVAAQVQWMDAAERERCQRVVERLTSRQLDVLRAFAGGQNPQEVAERLSITVKTVHAHKTVILSECRNAWELADEAALTYHFLREKFGRFFHGR